MSTIYRLLKIYLSVSHSQISSRSKRLTSTSALPRRVVHITTVRLTRHASTYEDRISALAEKAGLTCRKIRRIPEECARKHPWDALVATTKVIASPTPSVKRCVNASPGTAVNVAKLISKVRIASSMRTLSRLNRN